MSASVVELRVGARVWFEGEMYLVQELGPQRTTLATDGRIRTIATAEAVRHASPVPDEIEASDQFTDGAPVNVLLSGLTKSQRDAVETRAKVVRELLEPEDEDGRSLTLRCEAAASAAGVSGRTLLRWVEEYRRAGMAGLMDSRLLNRYASTVDSRWDAACLGGILVGEPCPSPRRRGQVAGRGAHGVHQRHRLLEAHAARGDGRPPLAPGVGDRPGRAAQLGDADRSRTGDELMTGSVLEVRVGTRLWFDGEGWTVCEVHGTTVRLQGDEGRYRTAAVADLLEGASALDAGSHASDGGQRNLLSGVGLGSLTLKQRARLEAEVEIFAGLLAVRGADEAPGRCAQLLRSWGCRCEQCNGACVGSTSWARPG